MVELRAKLHEPVDLTASGDMANDKDDRNQQGHLAMVGLQVAIGVGVGYAVGWWLDKRYGWSPKGVVIGSMIGLAGGLYLLIKDAIRINKD
jgi:F0F1-type ATP synthase assembly protein I